MKDFDSYLKESKEYGYIESILHSIVKVSGLPTVKLDELILTENGLRGIVKTITSEHVEALMLDTNNLTHDLKVTRTNEILKIPVSESLLGRTVNPLGEALDGLGPISGNISYLSIEQEAPDISKRVRVKTALETGVTVIDLLIPIGLGQRELILGDKKTGKTTFILQTIVNQASKGAICVYVACGKKQSDLKQVEEYLKKQNVMSQVVMVITNSGDAAPLVYLSPYSGMTIAEFFRDKGSQVIIIFDDLSTHAKFYREISLLSKRAPGRQSYPGDIFHIHAKLVERAGNLKFGDQQTVSITALPVAETLEGDITGYIQTNLMAMTDGHLLFDAEEYKKGRRPALNYNFSVSRVGNQTQSQLQKELRSWLIDKLNSYQRVLTVSRFGVELPEETKADMDIGEKIETLFNQESDVIVPQALQLMIFGLLASGFWDNKSPESAKVDKIKFLKMYQDGLFGDYPQQVLAASNFKALIKVIKDEWGKFG